MGIPPAATKMPDRRLQMYRGSIGNGELGAERAQLCSPPHTGPGHEPDQVSETNAVQHDCF